MPTALRALLLAALLTVAPVTIGVVVSNAGAPGAPAPYEGTALSDVDTSTYAVERDSFCDRVSPEAVGAALGSAPSDDASWTNGDRIKVDGSEDIGHEFGCSYTAADGVAQAWVFAPPVTVAHAESLVESATALPGCRAVPDAPSYGDPSVAVECGKKRRTTTFQGLFGDAWLTCRLTLTRGAAAEETDLVARAGRWCVAVAQAAAPRN